MTTITLDQFVDYAEKAVADRGRDFVYPDSWKDEMGQCFYANVEPDGSISPSCIVGHILWQIDPDLLSTVHNVWEGTGASGLLEEINGTKSIFFSESKIRDFAEDLQLSQDDGQAWGDALEAAKSRWYYS